MSTQTTTAPLRKKPIVVSEPLKSIHQPLYLKVTKNFMAGTAAGVADCIVGYPLETVKARLQTQGAVAQFTGPWDCFKQTFKNEGIGAFYRGMSSSVLRSAFSASILFGAYGFFKDIFHVDENSESHLNWNMAKAAACTGVVEAVCYNPLEIVKVRMQTQYGRVAETSTFDCAKTIYRTGGIEGFYKGFTATCKREMIGNVAYFSTYEVTKSNIHHLRNGSNESDYTSIILAGGTAGVAYWGLVFPLDTVKSVMQIDCMHNPKYNGMMDCTRQLVAEGGLSRLYLGVTPTLLRAFPACAAQFLVFESSLQYLNRLF